MPIIEKVTPATYTPLASYLAGFEHEPRGTAFWTDRFDLWWDGNPAFDNTCPRGWVLSDTNRIVGFLGCIPSFFRLHGSETIAYSGTTWRVDKEHRSASLGLLHQLISATRHSVLFNTTSSPNVTRILDVMGFRQISQDKNARRVYFCNVSGALRVALGDRKLLRHLIPLATPAVATIQSWRTRNAKQSDLHVSQLTHADEAFDELWERTRAQYANTMVRRREVINWYCFSNSHFRKMLLACYHGDRLIGYAICAGRQDHALSMLECHDLWIDSNRSAAVSALVTAMRTHAEQQGCDVLWVAHFDEVVAERLAGTGLFKTSNVTAPKYLRMNPSSADRFAAESRYFTYLQGDYGL